MKKYIVLLPHYGKIDSLDPDNLLLKFKEFSWEKGRREYYKRDVKYFRFKKYYNVDSDKYTSLVNVFLFPKINLFIYLFNLTTSDNIKDWDLLKITGLFKEIASSELSIEYLPERLIPFYVESYSQNDISLFEEAKNELSNNCYFDEINNSNELYIGKDKTTKIETLLVKTSFEGYFGDEILKQMIIIKSLKEYGDELSNVISDDIDEKRKLDIYNFIWNYLLYIEKSPVNGIFKQYLNLSLKPLERLLEYREQNTSTNIINVLQSIHTVEGGILILTLFIILDVVFTIVSELTHSPMLALILSVIVVLIYIFIFRNTLHEIVKNLSKHNTE